MSKVIIYRFLYLTFGLNSSSFLLSTTIKLYLSRFEKEYPIATDVIRNSIYVDDLITGTDTAEDAVNIYQQLHKIINKAVWICVNEY